MAAKKADIAFRRVTQGQGLGLTNLANDMGVSSEQFQGGHKGVWPSAMRALKTGGRIKVLPAIRHPSWGKVVFVDDVPVCLHRDWSRALNEAGPDTSNDSVVRRIGNLYPPTGTGIIRANFVLVPLLGASYRLSLLWAAQYELPHASPRHVFALAKHKPKIHHELLKMNYAFIVSPVECMYMGPHVCYVRFHGERRGADAHLAQDVASASDWVALLCE